jgi:hypothetical protein
MIRALDEVAVKTGRTRNEIVALSLEFALDNMEIAQESPNENFDLPLK